MKVLCENDTERGRGYVRFCCSGVEDIASSYTFTLQRASDGCFLGRSGWQTSGDSYAPDSLEQEGGLVVLRVGPSIVDNLDENENYRLTLCAAGMKDQPGVFSITNLNRSLRADVGAVRTATIPSQTPPPVPPARAEPEPPLPPPLPEPPLPETPPAPQKSPLPLILVAVAVLLLLGGGGAWWFLLHKGQDAAESTAATQVPAGETPAPQKPEEKTPAEHAAAEKTPEEKTPEKSTPPAEAPVSPPAEQAEAAAQAPVTPPPAPQPPLRPREQVRQYLGSSPTPAGALDLARTLLSSPDGKDTETQDSVYRLYYYAHQQGLSAGSLGLARSSDPATPAFGSIPKNAAEAWSLYAQAAKKHPEAAQAMHELKAWLESEAAKGNAQAKTWIEDIARSQAPQ